MLAATVETLDSFPEVSPDVREARLGEITKGIENPPGLSATGASLVREIARSDTSAKKLTDATSFFLGVRHYYEIYISFFPLERQKAWELLSIEIRK